MKRYREFRPPARLAAFVDAFWCYLPGLDGGGWPASTRVRIMPDGGMDLVAGLRVVDGGRAVEPSGLTLCGPTDRFAVVDLSPDQGYLGVRFHPGMAGSVLGVHPPELTGHRVDAGDHSPRFAGLVDRLRAMTTARGALDLIGSFLEGLAAEGRADRMPGRAGRALALFRESGGILRVSEVAREVGVSERTLHRDILATAGLPPKVLAQVLRFQRTVARLRGPEPPDLCSVALACGYADQSHMTREFRAFSGIAPTTLLDGDRSTEFST